MKKMICPKFIIIFIMVVSAFLRFYQLGQNPPSLTWDEVAWGYNAYSLGIDGKDEFGRFLPIDYLESFGDFKPPLYAYLDILPVKFFGLNEFATRFPSAFFGVLTVLITYFLTKRIFYKSESSSYYALAAAGLLAISPWHIMLSRAAFEANVATFFITTGVWFFLVCIQGKKWYLILSVISFILSFYTFNTARIISPLLFLMLIIGFRKEFFKKKREIILSIAVGILLILPSLKFIMSPQANLRFREVNIFTDSNLIETLNKEVENDNNAWWSKVIHNRRFAYTIKYLEHYFDNLNPKFLFIKGDGNPKFSTQDVGQLYLWEIPFLIGGSLLLFKQKKNNWWIIPIWLIIGIIPAATARETPHALRIEACLPTFQIIVAYGLIGFFQKLNKYRSFFVSIAAMVILLNLIYYLHGYYVHYPYNYSQEWQFGYKDSIKYIRKHESKYDKIFVTDALGRPYIYYLFYNKIDPEAFRKEAIIKRDVFGFVNVGSFGKYNFAKDLDTLDSAKKNLFVNVPSQVPKNAMILKTVYYLNGDPSLVIYE